MVANRSIHWLRFMTYSGEIKIIQIDIVMSFALSIHLIVPGVVSLVEDLSLRWLIQFLSVMISGQDDET